MNKNIIKVLPLFFCNCCFVHYLAVLKTIGILDTKSILTLSVLFSFLLFNFFKLPVNKKLKSLWLKFRY
ncbi:hypothetical protein DWV02_14260 [Citrobacter freundii]|nr:hypothetical protein DWV02_14260 [Citrobacter freundii]